MNRTVKALIFGLLILFAFSFFPVAQSSAESSEETRQRLEVLEKKWQERENDLRVYFKDGLKIVSPDKKFQYQIGGRIQTDVAFYASGSSADRPENGAEFRRARLFLAGILYRRIQFKAQFDFAGQTSFKDVYIGVTELPLVGNFIAGHFREPFSLEEMISSKYDTFMEDSLMNALIPGRNLGLAFYGSALQGRATWAIGLFRPTGENPPRIESDDGANLTLRLTGVPWQQDAGRLVHLGLSYSYSTPSESTFQFDSRPESNLADNFLDTGGVSAENAHRFGFETAAVWESLHVAAEYTFLTVQRPAGLSDVDLKGGYVSAGYFLTGERRPYKSGVFRRVVPRRNVFEGGRGAWELALRYSFLDLNDATVRGGEEEDVTAALNWYLNPHTRAMFNYVLADIEGAGGADFQPLHVFQLRFQIDF